VAAVLRLAFESPPWLSVRIQKKRDIECECVCGVVVCVFLLFYSAPMMRLLTETRGRWVGEKRLRPDAWSLAAVVGAVPLRRGGRAHKSYSAESFLEISEEKTKKSFQIPVSVAGKVRRKK
jgi:hypothetical protein